MVYVTDAQIAQYKRDGYLIVDSFLTRPESCAALEGFFDNFAVPYGEFVDSGLNLCPVHPDLIDACERIIGTPNIRLCEAHCGMKYATDEGWRQSGKRDASQPDGYHQDFGNNTLGPGVAPAEDSYQHVACFYCLDDVRPGQAPIQMLKHRHRDPRDPDFDPVAASARDAQKMLVPAGSLCFYSIFTYHAASDWDRAIAPSGHRPVMWVSYSNADRNRLWDGGRYFSIKGGGTGEGWKQCMSALSPRQLNVAFLFPLPGDPLWTDHFLRQMAERWDGFDRTPYDEAAAALGALSGSGVGECGGEGRQEEAADDGEGESDRLRGRHRLQLMNLELARENRELRRRLAMAAAVTPVQLPASRL